VLLEYQGKVNRALMVPKTLITQNNVLRVNVGVWRSEVTVVGFASHRADSVVCRILVVLAIVHNTALLGF
jgi:hypothetical protein